MIKIFSKLKNKFKKQSKQIDDIQPQIAMMLELLKEIYEWTKYKDTNWAKKSKAAIDSIESATKLFLAEEHKKIWDRAISIAKGCKDYGGGYRNDPDILSAYHHGMKTVKTCLTKACDGDTSFQLRTIEKIGHCYKEKF